MPNYTVNITPDLPLPFNFYGFRFIWVVYVNDILNLAT